MVKYVEYFSGLVGGAAGVVVGQPFDTIKVFGLFKGMASPLLGLSFINAIVFGVQAEAMEVLGPETVFTHFISGAFAGTVQSFICSPMELAKIKMQVQGIGTKVVKNKVMYKGPYDVLRKTFKTSGIRGCYRGLLITLIRETPAFGLYFASYDILISTVLKFEQLQSMKMEGVFRSLLAGGLAGCISWALPYPVDVIKSKIQADGLAGKPYKYSGILDCAKQMQMQEGWRVFFRGINATMVRAFPVNAATFTVVRLCTQYHRRHYE